MATKLLRIVICFSFIYISAKNSYSQKTTFCGVSNSTTQAGEVLNYKVFYNLAGAMVGAAEVSFTNTVETYKQQVVYHVKGAGGTLSSYDWFFKVRDVYESYIDTASMMPLKFSRNIQEGKNKLFNQAIFNHKLGQVVTTNGLFALPACTQDVLSAIYYARNIDFSKAKINEKIPFNLYLDDKTYPIYLRYLGKEIITTPLGKYQTIKFKPLLIEGTIFTGGENMIVYVSDDENKLPIQVETPILVGKIVVNLTSTKNLRYPQKAKLN